MLFKVKGAAGFNKVLKRCVHSPKFEFVPTHSPSGPQDVKSLLEFMESVPKLVVVTGAGISTESGIPDYRSDEVGLYARTNHRPVQYQEYLKSSTVRHRYWARNYVGWSRFSQAQPNATHHALTELEKRHRIMGVITQNVDNLHGKADTKTVVELHGSAFRVVCLSCKNLISRVEMQERLRGLNPALEDSSVMIRPDGDVELTPERLRDFKAPFCESCGGILKPDIIFFGDNVPKDRLELVKEMVLASDGILVLGSSLTVFSGYRVVLQGVAEGKKVGIVNIGATRADDLANLKISRRCGDILPALVKAI